MWISCGKCGRRFTDARAFAAHACTERPSLNPDVAIVRGSDGTVYVQDALSALAVAVADAKP